MTEFVITEKQLNYYEELVSDVSLGKIIRSHPLSAELQKERERVISDGIFLLNKIKEKFSQTEMSPQASVKISQRFGAARLGVESSIKAIESLRGEI